MSEPTVVVVEGTDDAGEAAGGSDFAAGVAAATAEQASEEAGEAVEAAEAAQGTAEVALDVADAAVGTAWDAQAAVAELREEMFARLDELRATAVEEVAVEEAAPDHPAPEPKTTEDTTEKSHGDEKPKRTAYGAKSWFG